MLYGMLTSFTSSERGAGCSGAAAATAGLERIVVQASKERRPTMRIAWNLQRNFRAGCADLSRDRKLRNGFAPARLPIR